jgi:hypothetical protein
MALFDSLDRPVWKCVLVQEVFQPARNVNPLRINRDGQFILPQPPALVDAVYNPAAGFAGYFDKETAIDIVFHRFSIYIPDVSVQAGKSVHGLPRSCFALSGQAQRKADYTDSNNINSGIFGSFRFFGVPGSEIGLRYYAGGRS